MGFVLLYMIGAFGLGVFIGKMIKWGQRCNHDWEVKGYGGAGWTLSVCRKCGERELDPS
jgi:hypothetical protein